MRKQDEEMKKMKFSDEKKKAQLKKKSPQRPSIVSNYSFVSLSEVTEGSLQVWRTLPEKIRQDPSLASFRQEHERLHGESYILNLFLDQRRLNKLMTSQPSDMAILAALKEESNVITTC